MPLAFYFIFIVALLFLNSPIAFSLITPSIIYILTNDGLSLSSAMGRLANAPNSFPLLAVPLFILLGNLMNSGKITDRLFSFARALVGHFPGGLAQANVLASIIFSGMSGAAIADSAGLGLVEIKAMKDEGYDLDFSCAVTGASATIGPIFPPSVPLVIFGVVAQVSVGRLLVGGAVPGLIIGATIMVLIYFLSIRRRLPRSVKAGMKDLISIFGKAFPSLLTIIVVLGGMFSGIVTPTEAAMLGVVYSTILAFAYRSLNLGGYVEVLRRTMYTVCSVMLIVGGAFLFSYIITREGVPRMAAEFFLQISNTRLGFLLLMNLFLIMVGLFMEPIVAILVVAPILIPVAQTFGIDMVHLGVVMVFNLMIGLLTPPFGLNLYVLNQITGVPYKRITKAVIPFYIPLLVTLLLITLLPDLVTYLPNLLLG